LSNLCVADHGDEDAEALPALRLCRSHRRRLEHDLRDLPRLHAELGDALTPGSAATGSGRVTGTSEARLPINPAVADHRDQIKHDLVWWAIYVADERGHAQPAANTVPAIADWLGRHVEWIAGHHVAAVECPPVMRNLVGRARALIAPSGAKRIEIGGCRDSVEAGPCGGTLWATVRAEDDVRPSELYCDGPCGLKLGAEQWRRWGHDYLKGRMAG
jgi:hypothetical protein